MPRRQPNKKAAKRKRTRKPRSRGNRNALTRNPLSMTQPSHTGVRVTKGAHGTGLSKCAELYAKALVNPFGEFEELPCVPCAPSDLTYRFRAIHRGSFQTGTAGVGFVMWSPMNPTKDTNSIYTSGTTYTGLAFAPSGTGVVASPKFNLPFPNAAFSNSAGWAAGRLVGSAIRLKNTTANLYKQGSLLACRKATGHGLNNYNGQNLNADLECVKEEAGRNGWFNWNWIPQDQEDLDFPDSNVDYSSSPKGYANFGILVQGASTTNPTTFDYELLEFWEFTSNNPSYPCPSLTKSHADPVGQARVLEAVAVPVQTLNLRDSIEHVSQNLVDSIAHSDSVAKTVEDLLGLAGMTLPAIGTVVKSLVGMLSL